MFDNDITSPEGDGIAHKSNEMFVTNIFHDKLPESNNNEEVNDASTVQIKTNDKSLFKFKDNYTNSLSRSKSKRKKYVRFRDPFIDYVSIESLKEFNLKMTYIEYDDSQEILSIETSCCKKNCIII
jgi:hypothetical protein